MNKQTKKIVLLAGGVGGAKMAEGFAASRSAESVSIIGNIADDHEFHGLWVSPDIDTLTYTLAGLIDRDKGWGMKDESFQTLAMLEQLGREVWMSLGDRDLAIHIFRTQLRRMGVSPSEIAREIAAKLGVATPILLPTDDMVRTQVKTDQGWLDFQEYFVREGCRPPVRGIRYRDVQHAQPNLEALTAIRQADLIVFAPSNPIVSIQPTLSIPGIREAIIGSSALKVAVSPLIGGKTIKGPADKMMQAAGFSSDIAGVAEFYQDLADVLIVDHIDRHKATGGTGKQLDVLAESILMHSLEDKLHLAEITIGLLRTHSWMMEHAS